MVARAGKKLEPLKPMSDEEIAKKKGRPYPHGEPTHTTSLRIPHSVFIKFYDKAETNKTTVARELVNALKRAAKFI